MRPGIWIFFVVVLAVFAILPTAPAEAQVFFSHDVPGIGLPFSDVATAPDEGDIFATTSASMCGPSWSPGTNSRILDNISDLGLLPGDNIDAYSVENEIPAANWLFWRFSVDSGSTGSAGTGVQAEIPFNAADIFWADGSGINALCLWEWQLGLAGNDDLDGLEDWDNTQVVYFSLAPGSPSLGVIGATPGDILGVIPFSGGLPFIAFPFSSIGLVATDDVDALTMAAITGTADRAIYFSVVTGATGVAGSAVAASAPLNGGHIFSSPLDGNNYGIVPAAGLGLLSTDEVDAIDPSDNTTPPVKPMTLGCNYLITPPTGVVPFVTTHAVWLDNLYPFQFRRMAAHIDVTIASGLFIPNWQAGFTNIAPSGTFNVVFNATIPALATVIGSNTFQLIAEDVTPSPYNYPPYPPSGDTCTDTEVVVATF